MATRQELDSYRWAQDIEHFKKREEEARNEHRKTVQTLYAEAVKAINNNDPLAFPLDALTTFYAVRDTLFNKGTMTFWMEIAFMPHAEAEARLTAMLIAIVRTCTTNEVDEDNLRSLFDTYQILCDEMKKNDQHPGNLHHLVNRALSNGVPAAKVVQNLVRGGDLAVSQYSSLYE